MKKVKLFFSRYRLFISILMSIVIGLISFFTIKLAVYNEVNLVTVPVVNVTITENTLIKNEMVKYIQVPSSFLEEQSKVYISTEMVGKYVKPNHTLYEGMLFNADSLADIEELSLISNVLLDDDEVLFQYETDGIEAINYLSLGNYIDIYFTTTINSINGETVITGLLVENARIIQMLNDEFESVFESKNDDFASFLSLAVSEEDYGYVLKALELGEIKLSISYKSTADEEVSSNLNVYEIKSYIDSKSLFSGGE